MPSQRTAILAGALLFAIGPVAVLLAPMLVGAYISDLGFTEPQAGFLASADALGMALASALGLWWVGRVNWRTVVAIGLGVALIANLVATGIAEFTLMMTCRVFASLGTGTVFSVSIATLGDQDRSERAFGIGLTVQTTIMIVALALSPHILARWGLDGLFLLLASMSAIVCAAIVGLPTGSSKSAGFPTQTDASATANIGLIVVVLFATALHFCGTVGFWTYIERIGNAAGLSNVYIGSVLALSMVAALFGSASAAWLGNRMGVIWPFVISGIGSIVAVALTTQNASRETYALAAMLFEWMWLFVNAYQMALVAMLDRAGRYVVLVPAAQGVGAIIGPAFAAVLISEGSYLPVRYMAGGFILVSTVLFVAVLPLAKAARSTP